MTDKKFPWESLPVCDDELWQVFETAATAAGDAPGSIPDKVGIAAVLERLKRRCCVLDGCQHDDEPVAASGLTTDPRKRACRCGPGVMCMACRMLGPQEPAESARGPFTITPRKNAMEKALDKAWEEKKKADAEEDIQVGSRSAEISVTLYDADSNCDHEIVAKSLQEGGGVKCTKCRGWFCY